MKLTKGTILKAKGGWDAEVIWVGRPMELGDKPPTIIQPFWAIHKPGTDKETDPIRHGSNGNVNQGPYYKRIPAFNGHPADLEMGEYEL
jgi:hypothetical protein